MDAKLQLVKVITLIYRQSQMEGDTNTDDSLIKETLDNIEITDSIADGASEVLVGLKETAMELVLRGTETKISKDDLLQRIRVNVGEDNYLYDALYTGIEHEVEDEQLLATCNGLRGELSTARSRGQIKKIIHDAYIKSNFREKDVNWKTFTTQLTNQLESYNDSAGTGTAPGSLVGSLDLTDKYAIKQMLMDGKDSVCGEGIMRLGWQGFNDMTDGGLRRGELVVIGALRHNFKSGMLLNIPRQIALFNKPYMIDEKKKPLIVYISLENELKSNVIDLYKNLKEQKEGKVCEIKDLEEEQMLEAAEFITEEMAVNGYHYRMLRFNPSDFTYEDLFSQIRQYEAEGFEVHLLSIDYLSMMNRQGCTGGNMAGEIRDLYRRVRNFCTVRQITLLTAHQLSSDATYMLRDGSTDFVKQIAGKSYYADCKAVDHEADLEITIHLEKPGDGYTYLTANRGKHRKPTITPEKDLYQVYRFEKIGGIPDDFGGKSMARKSAGGKAASEGGGAAWFEV